MADTQHYWSDKERKAKEARKHSDQMSRRYTDEIKSSAKRSKIYGPNAVNTEIKEQGSRPIIAVKNLDTVSAIFQESKGRTCVLNFASYKNPGGMFIAGSMAQEECLCHESFLYNVLRLRMDYYTWNRQNLNRALYKDRAIYSPDIMFERNQRTKCDVLTCAAPNFSTARKYCNVSSAENNTVLRQRIHFLLNVAAQNKVDTLILGAFGCGVFGQNPVEVAKLFHREIDSIFERSKIKIIFAVPKSPRDNNLDAFMKEFR